VARATYQVELRSLDGLMLRGTVVSCDDLSRGIAVLVHGGGVTRDEGGFFSRLAAGLADVGVSSLRFDLRGHGESEGRQEDLTLAGVVNDIRVAAERASEIAHVDSVHVIGASFGGGISAFFAARHPGRVDRLVLLNPLLNYKRRFVDEKPYWHDDHLAESEARELTRAGWLPHAPTFRLGRALLNEVFYIEPHKVLGEVAAPALLVHGTLDTFISVESSRTARTLFAGGAELVEVDGAQHGFAVNDDPQYLDPQTQRWQAFVIGSVARWLVGF
jgi:uncharacterized protein